MTTHFTDRPDPARDDARLAKVSTWNVGTQRRQEEAVDAIRKAWESREWPHPGLLSYSVWAGRTARPCCTTPSGPANRTTRTSCGRAATSATPRSTPPSPASNASNCTRTSCTAPASGPRATPGKYGCLVIVEAEFDGPDPARQRAWVDTVFEALGEEADLPMRRHRRALPRQHRRHPGHQLRRVGERRAPHRGPRRTRRRRRLPVPALGTGPHLPGHDRRRRRPPLHPRAQHGAGRGRIGGAAGGM